MLGGSSRSDSSRWVGGWVVGWVWMLWGGSGGRGCAAGAHAHAPPALRALTLLQPGCGLPRASPGAAQPHVCTQGTEAAQTRRGGGGAMRRHALRHLGGAPALLAARGRAQMRWVGIGRPCARVLGGRPRAAWGLASAPLFLVRPRSRTPPFPPSSRGGGPPVLPVPADPLASGTCPLVPPPRDMGDACTSTGVETRSRSRQQQQRGTKRPHSGGKGGLRSPAAFADSFFLAPRASLRLP